MATTHKKVIVRKMDRDSVHGYVGATFMSEGKLELMNTAGNVVTLDLREVKGVYFVREFGDTETLTRKTFTSRPRTEGLWVRLRFRDNEVIEGMMPNDLLHEAGEGFSMIPPDAQSNTQRIFVPRSALAEMTVIGVIGERSRDAAGAGRKTRARFRCFSEGCGGARLGCAIREFFNLHPEEDPGPTRDLLFDTSHQACDHTMKLSDIASALDATLENADRQH